MPTPAVTSVKVSTTTRDRLAEVADGASMDATIVRLLDSYQNIRARQRKAWEARLAKAEQDPAAAAWGAETADRLVALLEERRGNRP